MRDRMVNIPLPGPIGLRVCCAPRNRTLKGVITLTLCVIVTAAVVSTLGTSLREYVMENELSMARAQVGLLQTLYIDRKQEVYDLQEKLRHYENPNGTNEPIRTPESAALMKILESPKLKAGLITQPIPVMKSTFVLHLMPHLMNSFRSLCPAFHVKTDRPFVDVVIGIPTVKRDKESYLLVTLNHLIDGMKEGEIKRTLIVVMVGDADLNYVVDVASQIEARFPKEFDEGLIEVLSPPPSYYPDFYKIKPNLGDSVKRVIWRTKQNLDTIYLMAYARTKGTYYLMLEDDIIAKENFMQEIKTFTLETSMTNPDWFFIEFCQLGGIGKLFRSSAVLSFVTYVQMFYENAPIDWLLESYLSNRICPIDKSSKVCASSKLAIRPKYTTSLFQHIGLYSSLKGKVQRLKDNNFGAVQVFHPLTNPGLETIYVDIMEHGSYTAQRAYDGITFFWGIKPLKNQVVEFWFRQPVSIRRFLFRSGSIEHLSDRFYNTPVEALSLRGERVFTVVGEFDEFGIAEGEVHGIGPVVALRLHVLKSTGYWAILSEIEIKAKYEDEASWRQMQTRMTVEMKGIFNFKF